MTFGHTKHVTPYGGGRDRRDKSVVRAVIVFVLCVLLEPSSVARVVFRSFIGWSPEDEVSFNSVLDCGSLPSNFLL